MGMAKMFTHSADLSGILAASDTGSPLKVSNVIHKAIIEINEEGSEAAASTGEWNFEWIFVIDRRSLFKLTKIEKLFHFCRHKN